MSKLKRKLKKAEKRIRKSIKEVDKSLKKTVKSIKPRDGILDQFDYVIPDSPVNLLSPRKK